MSFYSALSSLKNDVVILQLKMCANLDITIYQLSCSPARGELNLKIMPVLTLTIPPVNFFNISGFVFSVILINQSGKKVTSNHILFYNR